MAGPVLLPVPLAEGLALMLPVEESVAALLLEGVPVSDADDVALELPLELEDGDPLLECVRVGELGLLCVRVALAVGSDVPTRVGPGVPAALTLTLPVGVTDALPLPLAVSDAVGSEVWVRVWLEDGMPAPVTETPALCVALAVPLKLLPLVEVALPVGVAALEEVGVWEVVGEVVGVAPPFPVGLAAEAVGTPLAVTGPDGAREAVEDAVAAPLPLLELEAALVGLELELEVELGVGVGLPLPLPTVLGAPRSVLDRVPALLGV